MAMRKMHWMVVYSLVGVLALTGALPAGDKKQKATAGKAVTVTGTVAVTMDKKKPEKIRSATLTTAGGDEEAATVYQIMLDAKGKALASELKGKEVTVQGTCRERKNKKNDKVTLQINVTSYTATTAEAAAEEAAEDTEGEDGAEEEGADF